MAGKRVYVAGHRGLVGSALVRRLERENCGHLLVRTHAQLDLTDQGAVRAFFEVERPEVVFLAAARVGGILANSTYPAEFIRDNLLIAANLIESSHRYGVEKLVNLGSSCIYPRLAAQPMKEEALLTGPLEPTNKPYAVAKIAALEMVTSYRRQYGFKGISAMPTNLYGPGDNFDLESSHVLPALLRKIHKAHVDQAEEVVLWGTGTPRREFLHCDDLADALVFLARNYDGESIVAQPAHHREEFGHLPFVEACRRFVEDEEPCLGVECAGNRDHLLHRNGKGAEFGVDIACDIEPCQGRLSATADGTPVEKAERTGLASECDIFRNRERRDKVHLLVNGADTLAFRVFWRPW
ncbi:GDP-L-fucose synthase [bacterium CPR1]|nr:GDP-L-fucose synthase [bacterium CPR1]